MGRNKYKKWHREQGICVDCPKKVFPGRIRCLEHLSKRQIMAKNYYKRHRQLICDNAAKERQRRKDSGLCISCSNQKENGIDDGYTECQNCRERLFFERCK